jgi:hypothetical protein
MPNWQEMVRQRVQACGMPPVNHEEVISELAAHLEEMFEDVRAPGLTEAAAVKLT